MTNLPSLQQLSESTRSNLTTFQSVAEITLNATERLWAIHLDAARAFSTNATSYLAPTSGDDLQAQISKCSNEAMQSLEQATEYFRKAISVYVSTQSELTDLHNQSVAEFKANVQAMLDNMGKSGPLAGNDMLETFNNAMRNSAAAYEKFVTAAREVANNNLSIATVALKPLANAANASKATKKAA
jgi:uncharacterized protein (DUF885 family)